MIHTLDNRQLATALAALRYWQREGLMSSGGESDIATDGGTLQAMDDNEIDLLCEELNSVKFATAEQVAAASDEYCTDEINIDDGAPISEGDDGIWVQAWLWVSNDALRDLASPDKAA